MSRRSSRRGFLRSVGAAALLTPLGLATFTRSARAATAPRAVFVYVPDGCIPSRWHPIGGERDFRLPDMSQGLERIRNDCVFIDGLTMYAGGATHEGGIAKVLTGASEESLDTYLGRTLGADAQFQSVQLGVGTGFQNGSGAMTYLDGTTVLPDDDPLSAFERLFDGLGGMDAAAELRRRRRASVLDAIAADATAMRGRLAGTERRRLDTMLDSIAQVERRVAGGPLAGCDVGSFNAEGFRIEPTDYYPKTYHTEPNFRRVGKLQTDVALLALSCGVTRVVSLSWSHPVSPTRIAETGSPVGNHDASHAGGPDTEMANHFAAMKRWFVDRFVELVEGLRAIPTPDGPLLDHTLIVLCSELGDSDLHDHARVPFVLAGGSALGLRGGRYLDHRGSHGGENAPHTKLLVSVARALGADIDRFGYEGHGVGPLEGVSG